MRVQERREMERRRLNQQHVKMRLGMIECVQCIECLVYPVHMLYEEYSISYSISLLCSLKKGCISVFLGRNINDHIHLIFPHEPLAAHKPAVKKPGCPQRRVFLTPAYGVGS